MCRRLSGWASGCWRVLQNDEVRRALHGASGGLRQWANRQRDQLALTSHERRGPLDRLTDQFGQGSLERRVDSIADVIPDITTLRPELAAELRTAESDLRRAVYVTGQMPVAKRWRAQRAISAQLDVIEKSLIDAVLSPR